MIDISHIEYDEYELSLTTPVKTSRETLYSRHGYIIKLYSGDGKYGIGDISPMTSFGAEDIDSVRDKLEEIQKVPSKLSPFEPTPRSIYKNLTYLSDYPATRTGLEQACIDIASKIKKKTIPEFLMLDYSKNVRVNGLISMIPPADTQHKARELIDQGYQTIKLKIGRTNFEEDIRCIEAVRSVSEKVAIRLDVNGNWSIEHTPEYLEQLSAYNIEYVEEPVTENDLHRIAELRKNSPIKIALDESAQSFDDVVRIIHRNAADVIIVKPVVCGGILSSIRIMHTAHEYNLDVVITSAFESAVGRNAVVMLAATQSGITHGLDTARYFTNDVVSDPFPVTDGSIVIDNAEQFSIDLQ